MSFLVKSTASYIGRRHPPSPTTPSCRLHIFIFSPESPISLRQHLAAFGIQKWATFITWDDLMLILKLIDVLVTLLLKDKTYLNSNTWKKHNTRMRQIQNVPLYLDYSKWNYKVS